VTEKKRDHLPFHFFFLKITLKNKKILNAFGSNNSLLT